ncbi:MAG TPA: hypothetical protein PKM25_19720, partial [Candidatus Ozemobacteraceae bacterium]|nr:hypothetical protein [Candidatus Ozemobacteraceae bacterium]
ASFPASSAHPARHVVNLLDEFAIATDDAGRFLDPALEAKLAALIEQIRAMADADPAVFARVQAQLEAELLPLRRARRVACRNPWPCPSRHRWRFPPVPWSRN